MALFALQAAADAGEPRVRLNPWRDWPPRRGSARRLRLHVAEHRLQAEQAGIAQGAQFVEADAGEDFHAAQRIGAAQGLLYVFVFASLLWFIVSATGDGMGIISNSEIEKTFLFRWFYLAGPWARGIL